MDANNQVCLSCITAGAAASGFVEADWLAGRLAKRPGWAPGRASPVDVGVYPGREIAKDPVAISPGIRATPVSVGRVRICHGYQRLGCDSWGRRAWTHR